MFTVIPELYVNVPAETILEVIREHGGTIRGRIPELEERDEDGFGSRVLDRNHPKDDEGDQREDVVDEGGGEDRLAGVRIQNLGLAKEVD